MVVFLQIIAISINLLLFISTLKKVKSNLRIFYIVLLIFQVVFVFPIVLEWFFGVQDYNYKSPGFDEALNDPLTNNIYSIFVLVTSLSLYLLGMKNKKGLIIGDIKDSLTSVKINRLLYFFCSFLMFLPVILILFSPSPDKYLTQYAFFQRFSNLATDSEIWYHGTIMAIGGFISLIAILIVKLFGKNTLLTNFFIYTATFSTGLLNGKRTLFTLIIFGILIVDILKYPKGKIPIRKIFISGVIIGVFFIGYAFLINKQTENVSSLDNIRLYFFRDVDVKFSIYALLNPERYKVFDYWGQSYIYNLFFYIPRSIWPNKPYPYDTYITAVSLGYSPGTIIPWNFQTSFFGEAVSNLGWLGIPFSLIIIYKFIKVSEGSNNPLIMVLCLFILMFSFMNHFGAYRNYLLIWLLLIIWNKVKSKKSSKQLKIININ